MSSPKGLRVVRGPDWKWGDQDGGEGYAGTVISSFSPGKLGARTVTILWDTGFKGQYRAGPKGSFDLRIVDNSMIARHSNVHCSGGGDCGKREIQGFRWQCATCDVNLCTACFFKEKPHNKEHNLFKRYNDSKITEPAIVSCWNADEGPESRTQLLGIYLGAKVYRSSTRQRTDHIDDEDKCGLVVPLPGMDFSCYFRVDWFGKKNKDDRDFCRSRPEIIAKEVSCGGYLNLDALPVVEANAVIDENVVKPPSFPAFSVGDVVEYDPDLVPQNQNHQKIYMEKYIGVFGIVIPSRNRCWSRTETLMVRYNNLDEFSEVNVDPAYLKKLNKFTVGQVIQIKSDDATMEEINKEFGKIHEDFEKIEGLVGRVTGADIQDPSRVYIQFDSPKIYEWLDHRKSLPSTWMDHLESAHTELNDDLMKLMAKVEELMFQSIYKGELRVAKLLRTRFGIDMEVRNSAGMTMLHLACQQGRKDFVDWLVNDVRVDVEKADEKGLRAIHYATIGYELEMLRMLIERGAHLDSRNHSGKTALHIAVSDQSTDCIRLLIQRGCNVNIQDADGNIPLHYAVYFKATPLDIIRMLVNSGKTNFILRNKKGLNPFHLAITRGTVKAIQLLLGTAQPLLLESKDASGRTPFLVACCQKDYGIMDLLIRAGADLAAVDNERNDAIALAATHLKQEDVPPKDLSLEILKMVEKQPSIPALFLIGYLMDKGCTWGLANAAGKKASDILISNGFHQDVNEMFAKFAVKTQISVRRASGRKSCMGRADCTTPPVFQLSCPHKPAFRACSKCFVATIEEAKCRCADEDVSSVTAGPSKLTEESFSMEESFVMIESEANNNTTEKRVQVIEAGHPGGKRKADGAPPDEDGNPLPSSPKREKGSK